MPAKEDSLQPTRSLCSSRTVRLGIIPWLVLTFADCGPDAGTCETGCKQNFFCQTATNTCEVEEDAYWTPTLVDGDFDWPENAIKPPEPGVGEIGLCVITIIGCSILENPYHFDIYLKYDREEKGFRISDAKFDNGLAFMPARARNLREINYQIMFEYNVSSGLRRFPICEHAAPISLSDDNFKWGHMDIKCDGANLRLQLTPSDVLSPCVFGWQFYLNTPGNRDLPAAGLVNERHAIDHWLTYGIKEGRRAHPNFSVRRYIEKYPDLQDAFGINYKPALEHFVQMGRQEGRSG